MPTLNYTLPPNNTAGVYYVAPNGSGTSINRNAPGSLVATLNNSNVPAGSRIILRGGEYRITYDLAKRFTLEAYPGERPIIKGSNEVTSWTQTTDANGRTVWFTPWSHKFTHTEPNVLDPNIPEAVHLDMVFRNGRPVKQTLDNPTTQANEGHADRPFGPGYFWIGTVGGQQRVYVADNPNNQTMEITARETGFRFSAGSAGTIVRGITFAHAARNGVQVSSGQITFENNLFAWNGNFGMSAAAGSSTIRNNWFVANGHNGISGTMGSGTSSNLVEGNYIAYNNVEGFRTSWNAAGFKVVRADNVRIFNNIVENNYAFGIWLDTAANNAQVIGNISRNNLGHGIHWESSHNAIIAFNTLVDNTWGGILVADASGAKIWNNTIVGGGVAIEVKDGPRVNNKANSQYNFDEMELIKGTWEITYGNVIRNNILSSGRNAQIRAHQVEGAVQNPNPDPNGAYKNLAEGATSSDGKVLNPVPLQHVGSRSMFYDATGTSSTWVTRANAISHNAFHNNPAVNAANNRAPVIWRNTTGGAIQYWTPTQFNNNTDQNSPFLDLGANAPLFADRTGGDFRLVSNSQAVGAGTSIPQEIRTAAAAAGIPSSLFNTNTPNLGAHGTAPAAPTLPSGWTTIDIGGPSIAGSTTHNAGNWTLQGSGADIWGTADQFHFARRTFNADTTANYTVSARVNSLTNTHPWAKAGVMIRGNESAGSRYAAVFLTPSNGITFQWRDNQDAVTQNAVVSGITGPVWVKISKEGNTYGGYYSTDGQQWIRIGTANFGIASTSYAGLALTSHTNSALATATFSDVVASPTGDVTSPQLTGGSMDVNSLPHTIAFTFTEDVSSSVSAQNLQVVNLANNQTLPTNAFEVGGVPEEGLVTFTYLPNNGRIPDGRYQVTFLTAGVTDEAGNPVVGSSSFQVVTDLTPPTATFQPFNNQGTPHRLVYVFSEDVSASLDVGDLRVIRQSNGSLMSGWSLSYNSSNHTATFTYTGSGSGLLPDGSYNVTLLAAGISDAAGNVMVNDVNSVITVDRTPPTVSVGSFNQNTLPHRFVFTFSENVSASLGTNDLQVVNTTTGQTLPHSAFSLSYDSAQNRATFTYTANNGRLPDGAYQVTLLRTGVSDAAGNLLATDGVLNFTIDLTPPTASWGGFSQSQVPHRFAYSFSENVGPSIDTSDLRVTNTATNQVLPSSAFNVSYNGATNTATFTYTAGDGRLPAGTYEVRLLASGVRDAFNNPMTGDVVNTITVQGLPQGFASQDIGNVGVAGSAWLEGGTWTVNGSGVDINGNSDSFHFVSRQVSGDVSASVRIMSQQNTSSFAKSGLMIRGGTGADAVHAYVFARPDGLVVFRYRSSVGGGTLGSVNASASVPVFVRLDRIGTSVSAFWSTDGTTWSQIGSSINMPNLPQQVNVGLAVTSNNNGVLNTSTFSQFVIDDSALPAGWTGGDFNSPALAGSSGEVLGNFSISAAGTGIGGTADQFHWVRQSFNASTTPLIHTTARVSSVSGGQAGVMIRGNLNAGSRMAAVTVSPSGEVRFIWRTEQGQSAQSVSGGTFSGPVWVRVMRQGDVFSGYVSTNGSDWTQIGSPRTITISFESFIGLVASSQNASTLANSTYTHVDVGTSTVHTGLYVEAEHAVSLSSPLAIQSDSTARGGSFIAAPTGTNSTSNPPSNGIARYDIQVNTAGTYNLWGRTIAPNGNSDSFWVRINGGQWILWNGIPTSTTWQWNRVHNSNAGNQTVSLNLSAGVNTVEIAYREGGTRLDAIYLGLSNTTPA